MRLLRFAVLLLLVTSTAVSAAPKPCGDAPPPAPETFTAPGPYTVVRRTATFVDTSRPTPPNGTYPGAPDRTLVTEIWYPGSADGAILDTAPFPLIIHSHGFIETRVGEAYAASHLASHGYVVVAPDYPLSHGGAPGGATVDDVEHQPGDATFVIDQILARSAMPGDELYGKVDPERIGASGLSLGGMTTLLLTFHREMRDPRIDAAMAMAAPSCFFTKRFYRTAKVPLLIMHGTTDALVPIVENGQRSFRLARGRKYFVTLDNGSHTGFTDFATIFDQSQHFDRIGCQALLQGLGDSLDDGTAFPGLGGKREGVDQSEARCPLPCTGTIVDPSMSAARHHDLTRLVMTAFFDAHLKGDAGARCALARGIDQSDMDVRSR